MFSSNSHEKTTIKKKHAQITLENIVKLKMHYLAAILMQRKNEIASSALIIVPTLCNGALFSTLRQSSFASFHCSKDILSVGPKKVNTHYCIDCSLKSSLISVATSNTSSKNTCVIFNNNKNPATYFIMP